MQKKIVLRKAEYFDAEELHKMQVEAFGSLFSKYRDYETSPATETISDIEYRLKQKDLAHYFICLNSENVGAIRVAKLGEKACRLSSIFILPQYQSRGYATQAVLEIEQLHQEVEQWELDTIKQEAKLCHFYEKMGYSVTGQEKNIQDRMTIVFYNKQKSAYTE